MFARMAAAYVSRISRGSRVHSFITWWGDSAASTVTAEAPAGTPRSAASDGHGLSSSSSATQNVNLPGCPRVERSRRPGAPPSTLMMSSLSMRPMLALARLPLPRALWVAFIPISRRTGPLTTANGALPPVLAEQPCNPNSAAHTARTSATTTRMYSGRQPAMTAAMAIFSPLMRRRRTGSTPTISAGSIPTASRKRCTRAGVGGTIGRPSVQPLSWKSSFAAYGSSTSYVADDSGNSLIAPRTPRVTPSAPPLLFAANGEHRAVRGRYDTARHAAEEELRQPGPAVSADHNEIGALGLRQAGDLDVGQALHQETLRAHARLLGFGHERVQLLLGLRAGGRLDLVIDGGRDISLAGHGHDETEDVHHEQLGAVRRGQLDRLGEGCSRGAGEVGGMKDAPNAAHWWLLPADAGHD